MRRPMVLPGCLVFMLLGVGGCTQPPADYSPNYTPMTVVSEDGRAKRTLVPDACLGPSEEEDVDRDGKPRLPPGCANAFNLQRMAERQRDLVKGRPLGKAPGVVSARAAQKVLNKEGTPLSGAQEEGGGTSAGGNENVEETTNPARKAPQ